MKGSGSAKVVHGDNTEHLSNVYITNFSIRRLAYWDDASAF